MLTVVAKDTPTAMDEVISKLGTDAMIVSTRKVGSEVEVKAISGAKNADKAVTVNSIDPKKFSEMISDNKGVQFGDIDETKVIKLPFSEGVAHIPSSKEKLLSVMSDQIDIYLNESKSQPKDESAWGTLKNFLADDINFIDEFSQNPIDQPGIIKNFAKLLTSPDPATIFDARNIFVVGENGVGKSTLISKIAVMLDKKNKTSHTKLIEINDHKYMNHSMLETVAKIIGKKHSFEQSPEDKYQNFILEASIEDFVTGKISCSENVDDLILIAVPAGLSTKSYRDILGKMKGYNAQIALTRVDEYDLDLEDMIEVFKTSFKLSLFSANSEITSGVCLVTPEIISNFIAENINVGKN